MKKLQKSDLKKGEIYKQLDYNYIFLYNIDESSYSLRDGSAISTTSHRYCKRWSANRFEKDMIDATPEEKHWLETCIKADQFVSYEEAMKTFIPEYVECISLTYPNMKNINFGEIGRIYKVSNYNYSISDMKINEHILSVGKERFKPSTKEAYDAQFVVKENTTVTKKPKIVFEKPKDKVIQTISSGGKIRIDKVECSEGGVYKIGDKITVFTHDSPNKGKVFTIKRFRWTNDKSKICAVTELHSNGIGLDKIELYVEPKVEPKQELSLLEQAKSRYPIGTKFKCVNKNDITSGREFSIVTDYKQFDGKESDWGVFCSDNSWIVLHNRWAEIVDDFVLPEKWFVNITTYEQVAIVNTFRDRNMSGPRISITSDLLCKNKNSWTVRFRENIEKNYTEITFEQFKKYVLKDESI